MDMEFCQTSVVEVPLWRGDYDSVFRYSGKETLDPIFLSKV